jgi:release factor glutamine methyltransferase
MIQAALAASGIDPREARLLLAAATGFSEATLVAFPERQLPSEIEKEFLDRAKRRQSGEPMAYILGHREFYGLDLAVNPAVLIPRPETELLVALALERRPSTVLDLGTGSGAVALAIKKHLPSAKVAAVEASVAALAVAQRNAVKHGLEVEFLHGPWFRPVTGRRFAVVVANPPYVASGDPHLAALRHEPRAALVAGADGLDAIREITRQAPAHLTAGGWLLLEHGMGQEGAVRALLAAAGLQSLATWPDLAGIARVSGGKLES